MKRRSWLLVTAGLATLCGACSQNNEESEDGSGTAPFPTAASLGEQVVLTPAEYLAAEPYASANRSGGERQAALCKACHSLEQGGPNMIGPPLFGIFGAEAGSHSGFQYSAVLRNADFVWTPRALDAWLAQPGRFLPGNRMTFAGVFEQEQRDALIAYLLEVTTATSGE